MKAIVCTKYGSPDVLRLVELETPIPERGELLIGIRAASVAPPDCLLRRGGDARFGLLIRLMMGWRRPRKAILGTDIAGQVLDVGEGVSRFKKGDQVYGFSGFKLGAYAEYICLPETASLARMPANLSYEEAASAVDSASTAYFFLIERGGLRKGEEVLINGASGGIGRYAVQLAKHYGAKVSAVCGARNVAAVKALGADRVIDYEAEDFAADAGAYDIIFDVASKSSFSRCKASLRPEGRYLSTEIRLGAIALTLWTSLRKGKKAIFALSIDKREALERLRDLFEVGILKPRIDTVYPLEKAAEAHRRVEAGRLNGKIVVSMG
jgi:NADPH:quinone reductase-like Zn-dependent oxidoreductase